MSQLDRRDGRWARCVVGVVLLVSLEGLVWAQPAASRRSRRPSGPMRSTMSPVEIDRGFVIFEGQYVASPYVVTSEGGSVSINGFEVAQPWSRGFRGFPGGGPGGGGPPRRRGSRDALRIEGQLRSDGLLICSKDEEAVYLSAGRALAVLELLASDESDTVKVQTLIQEQSGLMPSGQWIALVEAFEAPPELADRLEKLEAHLAMLELDSEPAPGAGLISTTGATVLGFALAVWALGTLLGCRPPTTLEPASADLTARAARQVVHLVVLIVILGTYDLLCTLFAEHVGGLWELNPFARSLVASASSVTAFKLTLTVGGGVLLVAARRSRLAQVGAWWIGVLYTVLILRWATYNSVFMA